MGPTSRKAAGWLCIVAASSGACAQVLGIEDWADPSAPAGSSGNAGNGGAGGAGTAQSAGGAAGAAACDGTCVEPAPAAWLGPAAFKVQGLVTDRPPVCPASWQAIVEGGGSPFYSQAICNACTCNPTIGACTGELHLFTDGECRDTATQFMSAEGCAIPGPPIDPTDYFSAQSILAESPICSASGGGVDQLPPPSWTAPAVLCEPSSGASCDGAQACVPPLPEDFSLCIYRKGDHPCPGSSMKHSFFTGFDDNRDCSPCECDTSDAQCAGEIRFYSSNDCAGGPVLALLHPAPCVPFDLGSPAGSFKLVPSAPLGCPAVGGTATGGVAATQPITVCCPTSG